MSRSKKPPAPPYHKGHLRDKLLREAARMIARSGVDAVSMRKLSDRLGISRTAAYHHFESKDALLAAVGQHGFSRLAERIRAADQPDLPPLDNLRGALLAYVRFATEETEFFRLMFANVLQRPLRIGATAELTCIPFLQSRSICRFRRASVGGQALSNRGNHPAGGSAGDREHAACVHPRRGPPRDRRPPEDPVLPRGVPESGPGRVLLRLGRLLEYGACNYPAAVCCCRPCWRPSPPRPPETSSA